MWAKSFELDVERGFFFFFFVNCLTECDYHHYHHRHHFEVLLKENSLQCIKFFASYKMLALNRKWSVTTYKFTVRFIASACTKKGHLLYVSLIFLYINCVCCIRQIITMATLINCARSFNSTLEKLFTTYFNIILTLFFKNNVKPLRHINEKRERNREKTTKKKKRYFLISTWICTCVPVANKYVNIKHPISFPLVSQWVFFCTHFISRTCSTYRHTMLLNEQDCY